jgi:hypothetical protein
MACIFLGCLGKAVARNRMIERAALNFFVLILPYSHAFDEDKLLIGMDTAEKQCLLGRSSTIRIYS